MINFFRHKRLNLLEILLVIIILIVIAYALARLLGKFAGKVVKKTGIASEFTLPQQAVYELRIAFHSSLVLTIICHLKSLFSRGLIHRVNQHEIIYASILLPSLLLFYC